MREPGLCEVAGVPINGECTCASLARPWWCQIDAGTPDPPADGILLALCPGFCLGDGGEEAPAAPCDAGCGWLGSACSTVGSTSECCDGLDCGGSADGGHAGTCCAPDGFPCAGAGGDACCSGRCNGVACVACVPLYEGPCTTTADCCNGVCENGGCQCVCNGGCSSDLDCCPLDAPFASGKCGANGMCE